MTILIGLVVAWGIAPPAAARPGATSPPAALAAATVATPWPAELPCARPRTLWAEAQWGNAFAWSSDDGGEAGSFALSNESRKMRWPRALAAGQLTQLTSHAPHGDPLGSHFAAECANGADVRWGPCRGGACVVAATYPGSPLPRSKQRTRYWTDEIPGSPWEDAAPDVHWTRFHRDIGRRARGDAAAVRETLRFSRAFVVEMRELLANACRGRRCSALVHEADAKLATYLGDRSPVHSNPSARSVDHWTYEWSWTATGGGVPLAISCDDMEESRDLLCLLEVELTGSVRLAYATFLRDVDLRAAGDVNAAHPLGRIGHSEIDGKAATLIEGRLLDLRKSGSRAPAGTRRAR